MRSRQITLSRNLRKNESDAERLIWSRIRSSQLGYKFRRQQPIGRYIADFVCLEKRLIIEIDGSQHSTTTDKERTDDLEKQGYNIIRFWNNEVLKNIEGVLARIVEKLE